MNFEWLPEKPSDWNVRLRALGGAGDPTWAWEECGRLSRFRLDFLDVAKLDREMDKLRGLELLRPDPGVPRFLLALLASSTVEHLSAGLRVGALRHGIDLSLYHAAYGQYRNELIDSASGLHQFAPDGILLALDAYHLAQHGSAEEALKTLRSCWHLIRELGATAIQQTPLRVHPRLVGNNERVMQDSPAAILDTIDAALRVEPGILLLDVDAVASSDGICSWHDLVLWHRAKQEINPRVSHVYGELMGRLIAAMRGRSRKCLVLDLDNTLWGGVIGEDGLGGIQLGQGTAVGEAYVSFQQYVSRVARRGIILAVCSKNDETVARQAFTHPEMAIQCSDIGCFVANWNDKAANLRLIAQSLNIGRDALVFVDDNPFERELVRRILPEVAVPEMPEDPAHYAKTISDAGYFEAIRVTQEDRQRGQQYQANVAREQLRATSTDIESYLDDLEMELLATRFDLTGITRIGQLINKTNQFNLTTRRYTEEELHALLLEENIIPLQFRLTDRFGDNGTIAVLIGRQFGETVNLDTWLMSCRVLGRGVEHACLNVIASVARESGATRLIGEYGQTARNTMVKDLYARLGFSAAPGLAGDGSTRWKLSLNDWQERDVRMRVTGPGVYEVEKHDYAVKREAEADDHT